MDASPYGYGLVERYADADAIADLGRRRERWRFKEQSEHGQSARASALDERVQSAMCSEKVLAAGRESAFGEAPGAFLRSDDWHVIVAGRFRRRQPMHLLEGEAFLWAVRRKARSLAAHGHRHVILGDNLGQVSSVARGRRHSSASLLRLDS